MEAKAEASNRLLVQLAEEVVHCPSCDAALKPYEVAKHCEEEMEQLKQIQSHLNGPIADNQQATGTSESASTDSRKQWTVFRKVQKNRQTRLKLRSRKRPQAEQTCPVCNINFSQEEIQRHAEQCLRRANRTNGQNMADENDDDDTDDDEFEEYEWAGQKRIRASSLLQGGYASLGVGTVITNHTTDDDEDLNVDEDDTQIYGPAQYAESDVISPAEGENGPDPEAHHLATYMRQLIAGGTITTELNQSTTTTVADVAADSSNAISNGYESTEDIKYSPNSIEKSSEISQQRLNNLQIIESLKSKLRHYENHIQNKFKCLICLDDYRNPAISVCCWHVHCEECWLRSLGARKLCPQCNLITSPKDLRRIYM